MSRSGDVNAEDNINNFDFFRASEALTTTWKVEVVPHQLIRETTEIQTTGSGGFGTSSVQRKTFFDKADTIKINATSGRTVVEGKIPLWELPAGKFAPVIVLQTKRGAYQTYRVPYQGDDANKQLRGPELPAWFAGILDLFGVAAGVVSTQGRLEEALKDYVPESTWVPLPAFSATITVDKEEDGNGAELDLGYLDYTYELAMSEEIGQDSPGVGLLAMGPGIIGAETEVKGTLKVSGRDVETSLTIAGTLTKEDLIDEAYGTKIAPIGGSTVTFPKATGTVSTTAATNLLVGGEADLLKFSVSGAAGGAISSRVSAKLNNYGRAIPYAGPFIGFLGDTDTLSFNAFIQGNAAIRQETKLTTQFARENALLQTRPRSEAVPFENFLGGVSLELENNLCLGIGFSTGLNVTAFQGLTEGEIAFTVGGGGCQIDDDIPTMELTFNTKNAWPTIAKIEGKVDVSVSAKGGYGPAGLEKSWTLAQKKFEVQFGTETVVQHFSFDTDIRLTGELSVGEGLFIEVGPDLVGGMAPVANYSVSDGAGVLAFPAYDTTQGAAFLRLADRVDAKRFGTPLDIPVPERTNRTAALELTDGRTLVVYAVPAEGHDKFDSYANTNVISRLIETDGKIGQPVIFQYNQNPIEELHLVQSGTYVSAYIRYVATDGVQHYHQISQHNFDLTSGNWGPFNFLVSSQSDFAMHVAGGGDTTADEAILHWVTADTGTWRWIRSSDTNNTQNTVPGTFNGAPASWATGSGYELIIPVADGSLMRYTQATLNGNVTGGSVLIAGVEAEEVALVQQDVIPAGGFVVAWSQRRGPGSDLFYVPYQPDGTLDGEPQAITDNRRGRYVDLSLARRTSSTSNLFARFRNGNTTNLRFFSLDLATGLAGNDCDEDNLNDLAELRIVDMDPTDAIRTVEDLLASDDFDGDGSTNGAELAAGTDPTNALDFPFPGTLPTLTLAVTDAEAGEWLANPARFAVTRSGDITGALTVNLNYGGTATSGTDYASLPATVPLGSGVSTSNEVTLTPASDSLAEGPETVVVTLGSGTGYSVGTPAEATLTIADRPLQQFRLDRFAGDANAARAASAFDDDGDGMINLLEYVLRLDPTVPDALESVSLSTYVDPGTLVEYLEIRYRANPDAIDVTVTLQGGDELGNLTDVSSLFSEVGRVDQPDGSQQVTLRSLAPASTLTEAFYQLSVTE